MPLIISINMPVSFPILIAFFIIPMGITVLIQLYLCRHAASAWLKFLPLVIALLLIGAVMFNKYTDLLAFMIGGFVSLLLLGTAAVILVSSAVGWILYWINNKY